MNICYILETKTPNPTKQKSGGKFGQRLSCRLHVIAAPALAPRLYISDAKVITCSASSAIKWQVHSALIYAEACTAAISGHERWNVLTAALQNKHMAVRASPTRKNTQPGQQYIHSFFTSATTRQSNLPLK